MNPGIEFIGDDVGIAPCGPIDAVVRPPGSKSQTQRAMICAALARGESTLERALVADDTRVLAAGLCALGIEAALHESPSASAPTRTLDAARSTLPAIAVKGCGGFLPEGEANIGVGAAGTAMRFLTAVACLGHGRYRFDGTPRMRERPIGGLVDALRELGANIGYEEIEGYPPLTMVASGLPGGEAAFDSPQSSQFISAVLMAAPCARRDVMIRVEGVTPSRPYLDLTIDVMRRMGVELLESGDGRFIVPAGQQYRPGAFAIEPDASSAGYFLAAAAVTAGRVRIDGLSRGSKQADVGFADVLTQMGCEVREGPDWIEVAGPSAGALLGVDVDLNAMPDAVQTLAVTALFARGPTRIRNVANLRLKETDRLAALGAELSRLGARVDLERDGITIFPPARVSPAAVNTYDDHRMAMSFAIAGLAAQGIVIRDAGCVKKSYSGFFDALAALTTQP
jgi:3-phosphoshikimate 1-carboxyvinyltransferase